MELHPEALTWTGLLSQWMQFAQSSLALPANAEGNRWRESVAPIINLQAVTFALAELNRLAADERPLALDKAEILINDNKMKLDLTWRGVETPPEVREIIGDAKAALAATTTDVY